MYSIDANPSAVRYMRENIRLNGVCRRVSSMLGDAQEIVERNLCRTADRVLMPLPEKAFVYLPQALSALKKAGGWVHYYDFEYGKKKDDAIERVRLRVSERLQSLGAAFQIRFGRVVRATGPNWYQVVLDIEFLKRAGQTISVVLMKEFYSFKVKGNWRNGLSKRN